MTELALRGDNGSTVTSAFLLRNAVVVVGVLNIGLGEPLVRL